MASDLFLDKVFANENAKIFIGLPPTIEGGKMIEGLISNPTTVQGAAKYEEFGDMFGKWSAVSDSLSKIMNQASHIFHQAQFKVQTVSSTIENWTGCDKFRMNLSVVFIAYRKDIDVRKPATALLKCVYPSSIKGGNTFEGIPVPIIVGPMAYDATPTNLISIKIGKWFQTPPIFLMETCSIVYSKEVIITGAPLHATVSMSFKTWRIYDADKIAQMMTGSWSSGEE